MNALTDSLLIIGGSAALSVAGMFLVRKKISRASLEACHEVGGYFIGIVGTMYAIIVGLVVVNSQAKVDGASQMAMTEANQLSHIYHLAHSFRQPTSHKIRIAIHDYAYAVLEQDWYKVEQGEKEATIPPYQELWKEVTTYVPEANNEQQCYSTMVGNLEQLSDARKYRMVSAKTSLSPVLWTVLVAGGVMIVLFSYFFFIESMVAQVVMTSFISIFISMNVYLIFICQNPYRPELGAKNSGFGAGFNPKWFDEPAQPKETIQKENK